MKEIGGYFGLELRQGGSVYHDAAVATNSARNALRLHLKKHRGKVLYYVPYYCCHVVLEAFHSENIAFNFYHLDDELLPELDARYLAPESIVLYVNYFGVCDANVRKVINVFGEANVLIDNTQAFFSKPVGPEPTIYSARKFFGVADGGFLYGESVENDLLRDFSVDRYRHLLGRIDNSASAYYEEYKEADNSISLLDVKSMSSLTVAILNGVDFAAVYEKRLKNFEYLRKKLGSLNLCDFETGQFCFPFCSSYAGKLKRYLVERKIYCPTYWPELDVTKMNQIEQRFYEDVVYLPIDQRYDLGDMEYLSNQVILFMQDRS